MSASCVFIVFKVFSWFWACDFHDSACILEGGVCVFQSISWFWGACFINFLYFHGGFLIDGSRSQQLWLYLSVWHMCMLFYLMMRCCWLVAVSCDSWFLDFYMSVSLVDVWCVVAGSLLVSDLLLAGFRLVVGRLPVLVVGWGSWSGLHFSILHRCVQFECGTLWCRLLCVSYVLLFLFVFNSRRP